MKPAPTRGSKPGERRGGRQKGTPNRLTRALKEMILTALDEAHEDGGVEYLKLQANENPNAFLSLVGKVLPMTVTGDPDNPLRTVTVVELVAPAIMDRQPVDIHLVEPE